eukprot:1560382-Amphidinium_carterae.2
MVSTQVQMFREAMFALRMNHMVLRNANLPVTEMMGVLLNGELQLALHQQIRKASLPCTFKSLSQLPSPVWPLQVVMRSSALGGLEAGLWLTLTVCFRSAMH